MSCEDARYLTASESTVPHEVPHQELWQPLLAVSNAYLAQCFMYFCAGDRHKCYVYTLGVYEASRKTAACKDVATFSEKIGNSKLSVSQWWRSTSEKTDDSKKKRRGQMNQMNLRTSVYTPVEKVHLGVLMC